MKKHIVCLGDSNTHGYCANPNDTENHGIRFSENERWTMLLQKKLGDDYLIIEEGLNGRTTVFPDPIYESIDALSVIYPILKSHQPIDLLIIMLGTNDTKERFNASAAVIARGMERLIRKALCIDCWGENSPNILLISPPPIKDSLKDAVMGKGCVEKSKECALWFEQVANLVKCHFMDAKGCEFNEIDGMHLSKKGHQQLADRLGELLPLIV